MKKKYLSVKKISVKVLSAVLAASMSIGNAGAMKSSPVVISGDIIPDSQNSSPISSSSGSQSSSPTTPPLKQIYCSELLARLRASYSEDDSEWLMDLDAKEKAEQQIQELIDEALVDPDDPNKAYIIWLWEKSLAKGVDSSKIKTKLQIAKDKNPEFFCRVKELRNGYSDIFCNVVSYFLQPLLQRMGSEFVANAAETYDDI